MFVCPTSIVKLAPLLCAIAIFAVSTAALCLSYVITTLDVGKLAGVNATLLPVIDPALLDKTPLALAVSE